MPTADFRDLRERLCQAGFSEGDSRAPDNAFGSWLIVVDTEPRQRVVRDAKDGCLIVQAKQDDGWTDVRIIRDESDQTAEAVIATLRGHA